MGFYLYLVFTVSWFLHLPSRIAPLGAVRFDLLLILILASLAFFQAQGKQVGMDSRTDELLRIIIVYVLVTIPFVEWPGSVVKRGIPEFIKAIVFYYFSISFITEEKKLRWFITVFLACQAIRVIEPLYLHMTEGYWGDVTYAQGEYMNRLSGGPHDIVNPNGLAYIIISVLPFLYFFSHLSWVNKIIFICAFPPFVYALNLTGSRSGMLGFIAICAGFVYKSKSRVLLGTIVVLGAVGGFCLMDPGHQERYRSIVDSHTSHSLTATSRFEKVLTHIEIGLQRPLFGHGLSTSAEAYYEFIGQNLLAHNLYAEILVELGFIGLGIFLLFMKSITMNFLQSYKMLKESAGGNLFLMKFTDSMQVWFWMNILFSFATFGLSSYNWYLFAGLSVTLLKICRRDRDAISSEQITFPPGRISRAL
jgi:O-antigen ligase